LQLSLEGGRLDFVQTLLRIMKVEEILKPDAQGQTLLHCIGKFAGDDFLAMATELIAKGLNPNMVDSVAFFLFLKS